MGEFKVLVVDDEPANVELLLEVFDMIDGCVVSTTYSPVEAIELYEEEDYALVLLDITMPDMDGFEVLRSFAEIPKKVIPQVYVLTGHHDASIKQKAMGLGATGLLTKPFEISEVLSLISEVKDEHLT